MLKKKAAVVEAKELNPKETTAFSPEEELKQIVKELSTIDYEMKTGKKDKQLLLELFLLRLLGA
ncbi:hypothetical protein BSAF29S_04536 [Bacillus safensis subsp. safensis]